MKKRIFKSIMSIIMVLAMVAMLFACNNPEDINNGDKPLTKDSLKSALTDVISSYFDVLEGSQSGAIDINDAKFNSNIGVNLSTELLNIIEGSLPENVDIDLSFINNIGINFTGNFKNGDMSAELGLKYGNNSIVGMNYIYPGLLEGNFSDMYVSLPGLSDLDYKITMSSVDAGSANSVLGVLSEMLSQMGSMDAAPIMNNVEVLLVDCVETIFDGLDIELKDGSITAGGVEQACTVYTIAPTMEEIGEVLVDVLNVLKSSNDLKALVETVADVAGAPSETLYAQLTSGMDELIEEIEGTDPSEYPEGAPVKLEVYMTKPQNIIGAKLQVTTTYSDYDFETDDFVEVEEVTTIKLAETKNGAKTGIVFSGALDDTTMFNFEGSLEEANGKLNGELKAEVEGKELAYVTVEDLDAAKLAQNLIDGAFIVELGQDLVDSMNGGAAALIATMSFKLDIEQKSATDASFEIAVLNNNKNFASVSFSIAFTDGDAITLPATGEYTTNVETWMKSFNIEGLYNKVQNSGLPQDVLDLIDMLMSGGDAR